MIRLNIEAENIDDLYSLLARMLSASASVAADAPAENKAEEKAKPAAKKAPGKAATASQEAASPASAEQPAAAAEPEPKKVEGVVDNGPVTRDTVKVKAQSYGMPTAGGPQALKELFVKHGSPNGGWMGVPDESLTALNAELDQLLTPTA